jgi:DNA invertase Pin-like site-specific DNA recombinase
MTYEQVRWVGHTRVSTEYQVENGAGLDIQAAAIKRWVKGRGDRLVSITSDEGVSGTMGAMSLRLGLADALRIIEAGRADGLVVHDIDRIGRDMLIQESVLYDLSRLGARLASVNEAQQDILEHAETDPTRKLMRQILFAFAEYERGKIRARLDAGRKRKMERGGFLGGKAPYGWRIEHSELVPDVAEQHAIAVALTLRSLGCPYREIGEYFVACQMRLRGAKKWHPDQVRRILLRAEESHVPAPAPLDNLARAFVHVPLVEEAV